MARVESLASEYRRDSVRLRLHDGSEYPEQIGGVAMCDEPAVRA